MDFMQLLLKDKPLLTIQDNGSCTILDFDRLPFAIRKENLTFVEFMEWAANRTLSIGRSYAKEILNTLRLPQSNRYGICKACRGLSLTDSYWIRDERDEKAWDEVNLFQNPLSLFITEISLSGKNVHYEARAMDRQKIHTPELTTLGASAKGWIRREDGLYLHKVGKYEIPSDEILSVLGIRHIPYQVSEEKEIRLYVSEERKQWIEGVGEKIVNARLFTSEDLSLVTFEDFHIFCESYGLDAYKEAKKIDPESYLQMQIADYILNNNDRHEQNWGFFMENKTGKLTGYCPLFDHDHGFAPYENVISQTTKEPVTLFEAAVKAQRELGVEVRRLREMGNPEFLSEEQWGQVLEREGKLRVGK